MKIKLAFLVVLIFNISTKAQDTAEHKQATNSITVEKVYENYLNAIGKKETLKEVKTINFKANVTVEGLPMSLTAEIKLKSPNKESVEMSAEGMGIISKQKFNGEDGYVEQQGVKTDLTEEQIKSKKGKHSIFPELYPGDIESTLEETTFLNGRDTYKIKIVKGDNITYKFYDTENHLLVRAEMESKSQGKSSMEISDYKEVNGILFPHKQKITAGMQIITMNYTDVIINENVTEEDFN